MDSTEERKKGWDKITKSPHRQFYRQALRQGWSSKRLESYAKEKFDEDISHDTFSRYRRRMPTKFLLPAGMLRKRLKVAEIEIDALAELQVMIAVQQKRVDMWLEKERLTDVPVEQCRRDIETLNSMIKQLVELQQDLGTMPKKQTIGALQVVNVNGDKQRSIIEQLSELEPERARGILNLVGTASKRVSENGNHLLSE